MDLTSSVLARPGAPVIRQWPPARSAIRIWSITSSWPTMTLASSPRTSWRPEVRRSTVCCSEGMAGGAGACGIGSANVSICSMRHEVKHDVKTERVRPLFGKFVKEAIILAFAFPPIAVVTVVRGNDKHTAFVVVHGADVHVARAEALVVVMIVLPGDTVLRVIWIEAALALHDVGGLEFVFRQFREVENAAKDFVGHWQLDELVLLLWKCAFDFDFELVPLLSAPEIIGHQHAAVDKVFSQDRDFLVAQP